MKSLARKFLEQHGKINEEIKYFSDLPSYFSDNDIEVQARFKNSPDKDWQYVVKGKDDLYYAGVLTEYANYTGQQGKESFDYTFGIEARHDGKKTVKGLLKSATRNFQFPEVEYYKS